MSFVIVIKYFVVFRYILHKLEQKVPFIVGTDTGASVRVPASFCGILGFRPSHGVVSTTGVIPMAQSFDTVGKGASILSNYNQLHLFCNSDLKSLIATYGPRAVFI